MAEFMSKAIRNKEKKEKAYENTEIFFKIKKPAARRS
jgi:hypothetical protein